MVKGSDASPHEFPWIVRIEINDGSDGNFCGGSIIDRKWVLTGNGKNDQFIKLFMSLFKNVPFLISSSYQWIINKIGNRQKIIENIFFEKICYYC